MNVPKSVAAFPHVSCPNGDNGMSLRDYFAAHALAGLSVYINRETFAGCKTEGAMDLEFMDIAAKAYCIADMMLIRRDPIATAEWAEVPATNESR